MKIEDEFGYVKITNDAGDGGCLIPAEIAPVIIEQLRKQWDDDVRPNCIVGENEFNLTKEELARPVYLARKSLFGNDVTRTTIWIVHSVDSNGEPWPELAFTSKQEAINHVKRECPDSKSHDNDELVWGFSVPFNNYGTPAHYFDDKYRIQSLDLIG